MSVNHLGDGCNVQVRTFKHATRPSKMNMDDISDLDDNDEGIDDEDMLGSNGLPSSHCRAAERRLEVCSRGGYVLDCIESTYSMLVQHSNLAHGGCSGCHMAC